MEMNNMDVKKLPVRNDKTQWEYHSRNVMFAKKCMLHENQFYRRRHIEYCDDTGELIMKTSDHEEHVKAVAPSAIASKARLYEFIVKMDTSTCNIRNDKEINKIIEHLSTSVTRENTEEEFEDNDDLNNCFNDMFLEREIVEESNNENGDDTETPNHHFHNGTFSNYSFGDIFKQGNDHLKEKNVIEVRKNATRGCIEKTSTIIMSIVKSRSLTITSRKIFKKYPIFIGEDVHRLIDKETILSV